MLYLCLPHFCTIFKILQPFRFHKFSLYLSFLTDASERILKISSLHSSQLSCTSGSHAIGSSKQMTHRSVCFFLHLRFNLEKGTGITLVSLPRCPGTNWSPVPLIRYSQHCPCLTHFLSSLTADGETLQFSSRTRNRDHDQLRPPSRQNFRFSLHNPTFSTSCLCLSYFLNFYLSPVPLSSKGIIIHHCKYLLLSLPWKESKQLSYNSVISPVLHRCIFLNQLMEKFMLDFFF